MKRFAARCTMTLCLLFAAFVFVQQAQQVALAQEEPKNHEPSGAQPPDARPEGRPEAAPQTQEQPEKPEAKPEKNSKQDKAAEKQRKKDEKNARQDQRDHKGEMPAEQTRQGGEATSAQAGRGRPAGGKGGHIPDDKFRSSFGRSHTFVISRPVVVNNQTTFVYGGYSFILADAWPAEWAYTDDCYIDYVDGDYFLFDLLHPGVRVALFVSM